MTSGKSKRQRRLAEAKKRATQFSATQQGRYSPAPMRSQAWLNARRRQRRRKVARLFGGLVVVAGLIAIVIVLSQRNRGATTKPPTDTSPNAPLDTTADSSVPPTTLAPVPPPPFSAQLVSGVDGELGVTTTLSTYKVTYDATFQGPSGEERSTNTYVVQRPFSSSITVASTDPAKSTGNFLGVSSLGSYSALSGTNPQAQTNVPHIGLADFRYDASLGDLVSGGFYIVKERRTLLGRQCQLYRTGESPELYLTVVPTETNYSDVCIDAAGLILEEVTVKDGSFEHHLVLTAVDEAPSIGTDVFKTLGTPPAVSANGTSLDPIDATKAPVAGYWSFGAVPAGYTLQGRYAYSQTVDDPNASTATTPSTPDPTSSTPTETIVVATYVDVYVDGPNTIVVQQGPLSALPTDETSGAEVKASDKLGSVRIVTQLTGSTMLFEPTSPSGWFVEIKATTSRAALAKLADTLVSK
jgi:hypothetical protein